MEAKGLLCFILEPKGLGNCSNNGISARFDKVVLLGVEYIGKPLESPCKVFPPSDTAPAVIIKERDICGGKRYFTAYPVNRDGSVDFGWMFGGSYIETSDGRFPFDYPIPLHDRKE